MARVIFKPWVEHSRHSRMFLQPQRQLHCRFRLSANPNIKSLDATRQQEARHRIENSTGRVLNKVELIKECFVCHRQRSTETIAVAT